jgi:hypothetical protein
MFSPYKKIEDVPYTLRAALDHRLVLINLWIELFDQEFKILNNSKSKIVDATHRTFLRFFTVYKKDDSGVWVKQTSS